MIKNICFIGNFYKTPVYQAIADGLAACEITTYWISYNRDEYEFLVSSYGDERVLLLDRRYIENNDSEMVGDFKINEIVFGDRVWKYDKKNGISYLANVQSALYNFIKSNEIRIIFGEATMSLEILASRMCRQCAELNCHYYSPMGTRIPSGRFFFFSDEKFTNVVPKSGHLHLDDESIKIKVEHPQYLKVNERLLREKMSLSGNLDRLKHFITNDHVERNNPAVITNRFTRLKVVGRQIINQHRYDSLKREDEDYLSNKKYVLFGFHVQPEASVDVCGRDFENQSEVVLNIWRQLPPRWILALKEHTNGIGNRSVRFFKELQKYPGIALMNESLDSHTLTKNAQLVVTNTGTMALEAALMGVPAVTLSKTVFNCLPYCMHATWQDFERFDNLEALISHIRLNGSGVEAYEELVNRHSYPGVLSDVVSTPNILDDAQNMKNLIYAFKSVTEQICSEIHAETDDAARLRNTTSYQSRI